MQTVKLASRPSVYHWLLAARRALNDAQSYDKSGNGPLRDLRVRDAAFCWAQADRMIAESELLAITKPFKEVMERLKDSQDERLKITRLPLEIR